MHKFLLVAAGAAASAFLSGCAGSNIAMGDRSYSEENSRAYNLARAAGLRDARDTALGDEEYSYAVSNLAGGAGNAFAFSNSAGFGLSLGSSLGLGLASALLAAPGMMERNSAFAFVPSYEASSSEDAVAVVRDYFYDAAHQTAQQAGFEIYVREAALNIRQSRHRNIMALYLVDEEQGCSAPAEQPKAGEICVLGLFTPHRSSSLRNTPMAAKAAAGEFSYPFFAHERDASLVAYASLSDNMKNLLGEEGAEQKRLELLSLLSSAMPDWFYIYQRSGNYSPPLVIENGQMELFITQKR